MDAAGHLESVEQTNTYITSALKCLLADEVIIMNKLSSCMLDSSSPFVDVKNNFFQRIYDQMKLNSELISSELKTRTKNLSLSINDIVSNTSIKKSNIECRSKVAILEILLADITQVIARLDEVITDLTIYNEKKSILIFKQSRESHRGFAVRFKLFLKQIMNKHSRYNPHPQ